tara:strand:- start:568 stop:768 length:201 start_codon:yes stop_codon:yes gene_type:complete
MGWGGNDGVIKEIRGKRDIQSHRNEDKWRTQIEIINRKYAKNQAERSELRNGKGCFIKVRYQIRKG